MRNLVILTTAILIMTTTVAAQDGSSKTNGDNKIKRNSFYIELLGNGAYYSINYDRVFYLKGRENLYVRIGCTTASGMEPDAIHPGIVTETGILSGGGRSFFDAGLGYTQFLGFPDRLVILRGGYRFMGARGFLFRAAPMYIYNSDKGDTFGNCLYFGISFGYSF